MATYSQLVQEICAFLRSADLTRKDHMRQLAGAYAEACETVNARLAICEDLLQRGMKKEAVLLAQVEPPLLDAFAALEFADRNTWDQLAGSFNLPCPAKFRASVVDALRKEMALQRQRPMPPSPLTARPPGASLAQPFVAAPIVGNAGHEPVVPGRFPVLVLVIGLLVGVILTAGIVIVVQVAKGKEPALIPATERVELLGALDQERDMVARLTQEQTNIEKHARALDASVKNKDIEVANLKQALATAASNSINQRAALVKLEGDLKNRENQIGELSKQLDVAKSETQKLAKVKDLYKPIQEAFKGHKTISEALELALREPSEKNQMEVKKALTDLADGIATREVDACKQYYTVPQSVYDNLQKAKEALREYEVARKDPKVNQTALKVYQDDMMKAFREFSKVHATYMEKWGDSKTGREAETERKLLLARIGMLVKIIP